MSAPHTTSALTGNSGVVTARRLTAERVIAGIVLADPAEMAPVAEAAGLSPLMISDPAIRICYMAAAQCRTSEEAMVYARQALNYSGYGAFASWGNGLERLADINPSPTLLTYAIGRLKQLSDAIAAAERHASYAEHLLRSIAEQVEPVEVLREVA